MNREEVIAELKRVASLLGRDSFSRSEFKRHGRVSSGLVEKRFGTWNKALEAAGLVAHDKFKRIADSELEDEWRRVHDKLGKVPTRNEFSIESRFSPSVYEKRFGSWARISQCLGYEQQKPRALGSGLVESLRSPPRPIADYSVTPTGRTGARPGRLFGAPLNFRELRHEPINEQGVVYLFGMVARELGFLVEGVATDFPDCDAKRTNKRGLYKRVRIEFEFRSSNFRDHGHNPDDCDLVVCWEHNWAECPIEVLELKSAIRPLDPNV